MATSISTLALDIASKESILAARLRLAPLAKFAKSFADAEGEVGDSVKVPVFTRGVAAEFHASNNNYTTASSAGVAGMSISLNKHPWESRRLLPDDVMETNVGKDWVGQVTKACVDSVAAYMVNETLVGVLKDAASAGSTGHVTALTISGANALAKVAKMRKDAIAAGIDPMQATLLLPSGLYTDLLAELPFNALGAEKAIVDGAVERLFGFGYIAELQGAVTYINASSKLVTLDAAIIANDALAVASRLPIVQNADLYDVADVKAEEIGGFSIRVRSTGSNSVDAKFLGAEVIFGWKMLQPGKILVASTTAT